MSKSRSCLPPVPFILAALSLGCGSDAPTRKATPKDLALPCVDEQDCAFGECVKLEAFEAEGSEGLFCTTGCSETPDCADYGEDAVCGLSGHCILSCDSSTWQNTSGNAILCASSIPVDCASLEGRMCDQCGCPGEAYCDETSNTCRSQKANGEECDDAIECIDFSCGEPEKGGTDVCLAHLGEPCTDEDCERCVNPGREEGYCTTSCDADDAPTSMRWGTRTYHCITDTETGRSWYKLGCTVSLPCTTGEVCVATRDGDATFCDPAP
jgi:hypothetical protein